MKNTVHFVRQWDDPFPSEVKDLDAVVGADRSARAAAQSVIMRLSREAQVTGVA